MELNKVGFLSPILFAIYSDAWLKRLEDTVVGCHKGSRLMKAFACADDISFWSI